VGQENYAPRHASCGCWPLDTAMNATNNKLNDPELELDAEVEAWDWARTAGVSAGDLRQALRAAMSGEALLQAA
jgi:hypothetical protein